jgi:isopentenyldiphosphate isomerase
MIYEYDELLDIVDEHDQVIDVLPRSVAYAENKLSSLRSVWLLIKNNKEEFWIPRRHASKKVLPLYLDGSAVGHVTSGETYEQALIRETQEELNFNLTDVPYRFIGKLTPQAGAICFIQVYELAVEDDFVIDYNTQDFSEYAWLSAQDIIDKVHTGDKIEDTLLLIMQTFYAHELVSQE